MTQLGIFEQPKPPRYTRAEALAHKWWGNRCPACKASPGDPCKGKKGEGFATIHGMRSRFNAPGDYMREGDDDWANGKPA